MIADKEADRLADSAAIGEVVHRWARAVDRREWGLVRDLFHPDAHDDHGMYKGGVEGLLAWLEERHEIITRSMHCICNLLIEFTGPDTAIAETYIIAFQQYRVPEGADGRHAAAALGEAAKGDVAGGLVDVIMPARYVDRFERRDGIWRIRERVTVFESRYRATSAEGAGFDPAWTVSRRDDQDALYRMRSSAGLAHAGGASA